MFAGWGNCHGAQVIEHLTQENRVLLEQLGSGRLRLTDAERCRLATKQRDPGRRVLARIATIVTRDTLLRRRRMRRECLVPTKTRIYPVDY